MRFSDIKELSDEELSRRLEELKESYMKLRFQHATAQLDSPAKLKAARRDIARINTLMSQRKNEISAAKAEQV